MKQMTQDKDLDREAFEKWYYLNDPYDSYNGALIAWQAALVHERANAVKVTVTKERFEELYLIYATTVMDLTRGNTRLGLVAALRAAGIRFGDDIEKEEGK